ncbi:leucine-rich repeat domain-containing protein [Algibacter miyuki]|uniref:Leucine-rich repeat domain-containing protein n=1 Tax=Algibacter miyuki TaxID=1306933 RepID=A0ABV5H3Y8_9FLAO|nr:leucine-rich repeat domain-containing protein [Algibacter miyuki]MDN3665555.1 leucine-rich repeat domain-containing protein [Algibacter miyuki]
MKTKLQLFKMNKILFVFSFCLFTVHGVMGQTQISSIAELAVAAGNSDQNIVMDPGVYQMEDYLTPEVIENTIPDANNRHAMIEFSGSNNTFDLTGVTIEINSELLNDYGTRIIELYVTGNFVNIKGLTITDIGNSAPSSPGMQSVTIAGENNTMEDVTLNINGSYPYGYGDLLGKGDGNLVTLRKHSGLLVEGLNINIKRCSIYSEAFGHLFFIQGGRNVLFEDCHAESVTRTTDDMLAETEGPAFDRGFAAVYTNYEGNKVITPGYTKSLSEVGYRSYGAGGVDGHTTGAITLINCVAKNTRSGFAFTRYGGDVLMQNCEATGCEAGYQVEEVTIENSRGDAVNGPLLYLNGGASTVELSLMETEATTTLHAIATIGGNNHNVTLKKWNDATRLQEHPIKLGATRPSGANPFSPLGSTSTSGTILNTCTEMPVEILSTVSSCIINTNGTFTDNGTGNTINTVSDCDNIVVEEPEQNTIGDTFIVGDIEYKVTNLAPYEAEVISSSLVNVVVPSTATSPETETPFTVTRIGDNAFNGSSTETIELPSTVTSIGYQAFRGGSLTTLSFTTTNGIKVIDDRGFFVNSSILEINHIMSGAESVGDGAFNGNSSVTSVTTPNTLSTMGTSVFRGMTNLKTVDLSASTLLTEIPSQTFRDAAGITSVIIPRNVTSIGASAFLNLKNLSTVQVLNPVPAAITASEFSGVNLADATLFVPSAEAKAAYEAADVWKKFGTIMVSVTLSTSNLEEDLDFNIYPNPTSGLVSIKSRLLNNANVSIYDLNGRVLLTNNFSGTSSEINMSNLSSGVYLMKVEVENNQFVKRIIKQ